MKASVSQENHFVTDLKNALQPLRNNLVNHPVYQKINSLNGLIEFSQSHVYAVWDFMSLLKSLQRDLTCVSLPWTPVGNANTRYLINEIVLGEESDEYGDNQHISHFELYLKAMEQMGAHTQPILELINKIQQGSPVLEAINGSPIHPNIKLFLNFTFDVAFHAPTHVKAAVFTFGREDLIPDMFLEILKTVYRDYPEKVSIFKYYIERHIEVDGDHHSHLALEMVKELCGDDASKWKEAQDAAAKSLQMRSLLWDAIIG